MNNRNKWPNNWVRSKYYGFRSLRNNNAFLWLIPRTELLLATILGVSYLGGAIAVQFVNTQPYIVPVIIQIMLVIAALYRFPELWQRFIYNETSDINSIL